MNVRIRSTMMFSAAFLLACLTASCVKPKQSIDSAAYEGEIQAWKDKRLTRLQREDGWLTLCGLFWLKKGENTFGSDSSNTIVFPQGKAPKNAGAIWYDEKGFRLDARKEAGVRVRDSLVTRLSLRPDAADAGPTVMNIGTVSFYVIKRADQYAIRMKDKENPARIHFKGLEYFPTDLKWRIDAKFEPYVPQKILVIPSVTGTVDSNRCPGAIVFELDGKIFRLDAVIEQGSENQLFIMFSDETSGKETYKVGRQLYTGLPDAQNNVVIDFNKAYNWPCVFTDFATCPIPPKQNHLAIRVEAGEKMYKGH